MLAATAASNCARVCLLVSSRPAWPASILFVPPRSHLAAVVEQTLSDIFPDRMRPEQSDGVEPLDLDAARAACAFDAQHFARDLRKPPLLNGQRGTPGGARVPEKGLPIFVRQRRLRSRIGAQNWPSGLGRKFLHLLWGRHSPGRWSVAHPELEHIKNESRVQLFAETGPRKNAKQLSSDSCSNPRLPYALSCGTGAPQPIALKGGVTRIFGRQNHDLKTPETEKAERHRPPPKSPDRGIEGNHDGACDAGGVGTVRRREHH